MMRVPAGRPECHQVLAASNDEKADARLPLCKQGTADYAIPLACRLPVRENIVGLVEIERIDIADIDELGQLKGFAAILPESFYLPVLDLHEFSGAHLIPADDISCGATRPTPGTTLLCLTV